MMTERDLAAIDEAFARYFAMTGDALAASNLVLAATQANGKPTTRDEPASEDADYLTVRQAARKYNLGERTVYRMVEEGLPVTRVGRAVRIKPKDLARRLEHLGTRLR